MTLIFGFGHRRYVGKDTCANFAVSHVRANRRGIMVIKTGFSSKLKAVAYDLYSWAGLMDEEYYEQHPELKDVIIPAIGKSARQIWIELGTSVGRAIYNDTWLVYVLKKKCDYLFLKDVRFPNEADAILDSGGYVFRIDNPRIEKYNDVADSALASYDKWSGVIINDGDMTTLNKRVIETIHPLM